MSKLIAAPAAQGNVATLFVGFELSKSTWLIGLYAPELGSTISRHKIDGGDLEKAIALIEAARKRLAGRGKPVRVVSVYEAGYDGFWIHRALMAAGIENRSIDAASIPVDRRSRRPKTDRLDLELLIRMLLALERGETRICRVVRVPTPAEEDAKRQHRERQVLVADRTAHSNRIKGILMTLGIRDANPRRRDFTEHLETLRAATGDPLPPLFNWAGRREWSGQVRVAIRCAGSAVSVWSRSQPCFLAVEISDRITAKSAAPCSERKPPEIFCRNFIIRPSRSARLLVNGTLGSVRKRSTSALRVLSRSSRLWPIRRGGGPRGLAFYRAGCAVIGQPVRDDGIVAAPSISAIISGLSGRSCARARFTAWQARRSSRCIRRAQSSFSISTSAFSSRRWCALQSACSTPVIV